MRYLKYLSGFGKFVGYIIGKIVEHQLNNDKVDNSDSKDEGNKNTIPPQQQFLHDLC